MQVLVAGVSSEKQYMRGSRSFYDLVIQPGDKKAVRFGTRGDMARMQFGTELLKNKQFDAILLLDLDMDHPPDLLERLRAHNVDMVTGHYFRRHIEPMRSVVSTISLDDSWPYIPLITIPDDGMHEIACTGFGCVLIKREVVEAVMELLPRGSPPFSLGPMPEMANNDHGPMGSDYNFFIRARRLGYKLWLDASLESKHVCSIWLDRELYKLLGGETQEYWKKLGEFTMSMHGINAVVIESRINVLKEAIAKLERGIEKLEGDMENTRDALKVAMGQLAESQMYLNELQTQGRGDMYKIGSLPVFETQEELDAALANRGKAPENVIETREQVQQEHAKDILDAISGEEETP